MVPAPSSEPTEQSEATQIPNPVVEFNTPDFSQDAGFAVTGYPEGDGISLTRCALIAKTVAELEFSFDEPGLTATLRVAHENGQDISGLYGQTYESVTLQEMNGIACEVSGSAGGPFLARWSKDGYAFTLWMEHAPMGVFGGVLPRFIAANATPAVPERPSPVQLAQPKQISDMLGITVEGLPANPIRCWIVSERVAQLDWEEQSGGSMMLRVAADDGGDISGCYYPAPTSLYGGETREETIDGINVTLRDCENGNFRADWVKNGVGFHLWLPTYEEETLQRFLQADASK